MNSEKASRKDFGPLESEVMEAVWRADGPVVVREVVDALNRFRTEPLAYTTVMTVMSRLAEKDALTRRKAGRGYAYEANAPDAAGIAVKDVLRTYGDVAVAHFVDQARSDPSFRRRLRRMLDEADG
ncbi:MAG TPA: BlaI/MecI/CopY family transcriptional regulator [Solirubrobacterales bacterium]|nr:BlaI/MecI/CopY family transcriptional regulator [Solirubrobacterales bacterium]